jgi:hypothetical protein
MGVSAAVVMGAGTAISAYGQYQAGKENAKLLNTNAAAAELQAEDAMRRGFLESSRHLSSVRRLQGTQRAAYAGSGVDAFSGSASEVQEESRLLGELDAMTIRNNAAREAFGYRHQASIDRYNSQRSSRMGGLNSFTTLLTGGSQAYMVYRGTTKNDSSTPESNASRP